MDNVKMMQHAIIKAIIDFIGKSTSSMTIPTNEETVGDKNHSGLSPWTSLVTILLPHIMRI